MQLPLGVGLCLSDVADAVSTMKTTAAKPFPGDLLGMCPFLFLSGLDCVQAIDTWDWYLSEGSL